MVNARHMQGHLAAGDQQVLSAPDVHVAVIGEVGVIDPSDGFPDPIP